MDFLVWYYTTAWREVTRAASNLLHFWWYFFSVPWLLRTLVRPWHRDITPYGRGFDIREFGQTLLNNLVSRAMGFAMRASAIAVWMLLDIVTALGGFLFVVVWPVLVPVVIFSLLLGAYALFSAGAIVAVIVASPALVVALLMARAFLHRQRLQIAILPGQELPARAPVLWQAVLRRLNYAGEPTTFFDQREGFLASQNLTEEDFERVVAYEREKFLARERRHRFWDAQNLFAVAPLGRSWAYGYTVNLDRVGRELRPTHEAPRHHELIEYAREVTQIETILSRSREANALIVGEPGVGREAALETFARELNAGRLANIISHKRLVELRSDAVPDAALFSHILDEAAYAGNIILVLPAFENFLKHSEMLMPHLGARMIQFIGITSYAALHEALERAPETLGHFEKVEVKEPDVPSTAHILLDLVGSLETRTGVFCPYPALKAIVERADRYVQDVPFPKKAVDLLDRVMTLAAERGSKTVTGELVDEVVSEKTEIPVGKPQEAEKELLLNLEAKLHERLINQEEAVRQIADALRRARADIRAADRPVGTFLFLGPTGVGKTETAKALARLYYGKTEAMIRLDMSEFQEVEAIRRFIGDVPTNTPGALTTAIRENPASLVLLDEIEKAHPNILNLFLQVLDDARLTDAWGRTVKFTSAFIICTSNAGSEFIREQARAGTDPALFRETLIEHLQREGIFRPEFLNRFDGVIIFRTLNETELQQIALLLLGDLAERLGQKHIVFVPTPELAAEVAAKGYSPEFGARPMRRVIQDEIESTLAKKMLAGTFERGTTLAPKSFAELAEINQK